MSYITSRDGERAPGDLPHRGGGADRHRGARKEVQRVASCFGIELTHTNIYIYICKLYIGFSRR